MTLVLTFDALLIRYLIHSFYQVKKSVFWSLTLEIKKKQKEFYP